MGGVDKTRLALRGESLVARALAALRPQSAEQFVVGARCESDLDVPVYADAWPGQPGPLAGIYTALLHARHPDVLIAPADAPLLPPDLLARLAAARAAAGTELACVHDGEGLQPLFALLPARRVDAARDALAAGHYSVREWLGAQGCAIASFSDWPRWAWSVNTPAEWAVVQGHCA